MSKKKLEEFVVKLSEDPKLNQSYVDNPESVMKSFGLNDQEIKAVMTGDKKQMEELIGTQANLITIIKIIK